jgi:1-acyl-sn-glycerol-3-phosphate acyltransferase
MRLTENYSEIDKYRNLYAASHWAVQKFGAVALGVKIIGQEHIPMNSGAMIASNHRHWTDILLLPSSVPNRHVRMVARHTILENPQVGWLFKAWGAMPIHREEDWPQDVAITREQREIAVDERKAIADAARAGYLVSMFPEGTRDKNRPKAADKADMGEFKKGIARITQKAGVDTIPAALVGTDLGLLAPKAAAFGEPMEKPTGDLQVWLGELRSRIDGLYEQVYEELTA